MASSSSSPSHLHLTLYKGAFLAEDNNIQLFVLHLRADVKDKLLVEVTQSDGKPQMIIHDQIDFRGCLAKIISFNLLKEARSILPNWQFQVIPALTLTTDGTTPQFFPRYDGRLWMSTPTPKIGLVVEMTKCRSNDLPIMRVVGYSQMDGDSPTPLDSITRDDLIHHYRSSHMVFQLSTSSLGDPGPLSHEGNSCIFAIGSLSLSVIPLHGINTKAGISKEIFLIKDEASVEGTVFSMDSSPSHCVNVYATVSRAKTESYFGQHGFAVNFVPASTMFRDD